MFQALAIILLFAGIIGITAVVCKNKTLKYIIIAIFSLLILGVIVVLGKAFTSGMM